LRGFLRFAAAVSAGDAAAARAALPRAGAPTPSTGAGPAAAVVEQLARALRERGVQVAEQVGESSFRCHLALRRPADPLHRVAVLVDGEHRTGSESVEERLLNQPAALAAVGWQVAQVLTQDWQARPEQVLDQLCGLLPDTD